MKGFGEEGAGALAYERPLVGGEAAAIRELVGQDLGCAGGAVLGRGTVFACGPMFSPTVGAGRGAVLLVLRFAFNGDMCTTAESADK